jgi:hypothetical protein
MLNEEEGEYLRFVGGGGRDHGRPGKYRHGRLNREPTPTQSARKKMTATIKTMDELHTEGRSHGGCSGRIAEDAIEAGEGIFILALPFVDYS